ETRDFIYVDDLVGGLYRSAMTPGAHGGAFTIGTGVQSKVIERAKMIISETKSKSATEYAPRRSWDHSTHRQADVSRAGGTLGFQPRVRISDGIARTVAWFRENYDQIVQAVGDEAVQVGAAR